MLLDPGTAHRIASRIALTRISVCTDASIQDDGANAGTIR